MKMLIPACLVVVSTAFSSDITASEAAAEADLERTWHPVHHTEYAIVEGANASRYADYRVRYRTFTHTFGSLGGDDGAMGWDDGTPGVKQTQDCELHLVGGNNVVAAMFVGQSVYREQTPSEGDTIVRIHVTGVQKQDIDTKKWETIEERDRLIPADAIPKK